MKRYLLICGLIPFVACNAGAEENTATQRPNILFCIADDASMNSFGAYGDTFIETPAIDRLAREGVVFRNAYNCNPKCSPARACHCCI
jgi:N-sulfoglucosamine sulfohydrolase